MSPNELQRRQQNLLIQSTGLRLQLRRDFQRLERPAARADQARAALLWLYQHPQWPAGVLALLLILKPKRALVWTGKVWWLWKSTRLLRRLSAPLLAYFRQR